MSSSPRSRRGGARPARTELDAGEEAGPVPATALRRGGRRSARWGRWSEEGRWRWGGGRSGGARAAQGAVAGRPALVVAAGRPARGAAARPRRVWGSCGVACTGRSSGARPARGAAAGQPARGARSTCTGGRGPAGARQGAEAAASSGRRGELRPARWIRIKEPPARRGRAAASRRRGDAGRSRRCLRRLLEKQLFGSVTLSIRTTQTWECILYLCSVCWR